MVKPMPSTFLDLHRSRALTPIAGIYQPSLYYSWKHNMAFSEPLVQCESAFAYIHSDVRA